MRILLSAYSCEPNHGSEPEVGWQRAMHMRAYADEVCVLTRRSSRAAIEADAQSREPGLHFIYYDLPWWPRNSQETTRFYRVYSTLWQWGAYRLAARLHREKPFDRVYHVTFASMRFGSFMGRLGIPFVIGPVAGGERAPWRLRRSMPVCCRAFELLRDLGILFQRYGPLTHTAFAAAERIYVTTPESLRLISPKWRSKTAVHLAIATDVDPAPAAEWRTPAFPRFVFAGQLIHLKGVHFAIQALAEVRRRLPQATLTLIGAGPDERWLRDVAKRSGVADAVHFAGQIPRQQLADSFRSYTALVFPSLRDSGGMVVLEAFSKGLPVVCLDLGGPGVMVNSSCGIVVLTAEADEAQIVAGVAKAMLSLGTMPAAELKRLSIGAIARANELSWTRLTEAVASCHEPERINAAIMR